MKLNPKQLRDLEESSIADQLSNVKRQPLYFILENIYDTYNVGGLFRLADALAIEKMYLVGGTETPPNTRIKKASIGTYKVVPWEYRRSASEAIEELRKGKGERVKVVAVEQHKKAVSYTQADYTLPVALLFGNETYGVIPETLKLVDEIVEIPMWGINKSLNVIVSAAIVSYFAITPSDPAGRPRRSTP